jgi:hypothetical protein
MTGIALIITTVLLGVTAVTTVDIIGSITSRKWNYNYSSLTPASFIVYMLIGFHVGRDSNVVTAIGTTCLVGIYDATVGWKLSLIFKANWGKYEERVQSMTTSSRLLQMIVIGIVFGFAGYFLSTM